MFRIAVRNIVTHKARLLMTMLAVVLGTAFVAGTLVFSDTVRQGFQNSTAADVTGVDVAVRPTSSAGTNGRPAGLTDDLLARVRALPGVASARGQVSGTVYVIDRSNTVIGKQSLGADIAPGGDPNHTVTSGRAPANADEIALDAATAGKAGAAVGDTVRVTVDGPVRSERLVGLVSTTDPAVSTGATLAVFDTATAQRLFGTPGQYTRIAVTAAAGTTADRLVGEIRPLLGPNAEADTAARVVADARAASQSTTTDLGEIFFGFAMIALFVATFLIANTFSMLITQRTRELALLRALGASRRQVTRSVQAEAFLVGLASSAVGLGLGIPIGIGIRAVFGSLTGTYLPGGPPVVAPTTVLIALLTGTAVTMLAAWLPGRRAARIPPVAAMRSGDATPTPASLRLRNIIGFVLVALSVGMVVLGVSIGGAHAADGGYLIGAGGGLLIIALVVLTPFLAGPLLGVLDRPLTRWFGVAGKLATGNARRNPRRTASTTAALMLGLVLITSLTLVSASLANALGQSITGNLDAQFAVGTINHDPLDPAVTGTVAGVPGVTTATPLRAGTAESIGTRTGAPLTGVDPARFADVVSLRFIAGSAAGLESGILVAQNPAKALHLNVGDAAPVTFADGKRENLRVAGIFTGDPLLNEFVVSLDTVDRHTTAPREASILVRADPAQADAVPGRIRAALAGNPLIQVQNHDDLQNEIATEFEILLNLVYGLLGMALVISVLGVVNTMAMSVFERTREIGLLRAIGLWRNGVRRMIRLESVVISMFGAVLGIAVGIYVAWALGTLFGGSPMLRDAYHLLIPWDRVGLFVVVAALVGVIAAVWPARKAANLNVLQAIRTE